ncbi:MAG: hypothetical protein PHQ04_09680 [Opitutaceae bacterium]|nr:hypothetical protein [Opitutaceae bacterium]
MLVHTAVLRPCVMLYLSTIAKSGPGLTTASRFTTAILANSGQ